MTCNKCSKEIPEDAAFCGYCGAINMPPNKSSEEVEGESIIAESNTAATTDFVVTEVAPSAALEVTDVVVRDEVNTESAVEITVTQTLEDKPEPIQSIIEPTVTEAPIIENATYNHQNEAATEKSAHYSHDTTQQETAPVNNTAHMVPPVKTSTFFWMMLLMAIPIVNIVMLLVWSFSEKINVNCRNLSRAALIWSGIIIAISIVSLLVFIITLVMYGNYFTQPLLYFNY